MASLPSIGVIGAGFVGGSLIRGFSQYTDVKVFDTGKGIGSLEEVALQDIIFICLPTPMKRSGECDTSLIRRVAQELDEQIMIQKITQAKPVIIKSTAPPRFFYEVNADNGCLQIMYMPEFLTERTADIDFLNSSRFILGCQDGVVTPETKLVQRLFEGRFPRTRFETMTWEEASLVKYGTNCFFTVKISFLNELYKLAEKLGADPTTVIEELMQDGRIGRSHFMVPGHDGDFGYGGHCFPKDNQAYQYFSEQEGATSMMVKAAQEVNDIVRKDRDWEAQKGRAVVDDD